MFCHSCKALSSLSITSYASLRIAVGCLARTVCRGRTLHAAARVAPGGLAVPIHLDRTLNPPQMVAVRRLPMAVGLLGHLDTPGAVSKRRLAVPVRRVRSLNPPERITPGGRAGAIRRHRPLQPPGGVPVCYLSTWVASHRTLYPSLSVPISRLPEPVRFIRPGYPALPVTIDRLPGSIRVNRPLSATRRIIICRRRSQSLHLRLHRVRRKQSPCRTFVANREGPSTNLHESTCISIRENSCQFVDRTRKAKAVARPSRLRTRQARPSCIFAGSKGCTFSVVFLYTSTLIRSLSFASPAGNGSSQPANQLRRFTFCVEDRFFFVLSA